MGKKSFLGGNKDTDDSADDAAAQAAREPAPSDEPAQPGELPPADPRPATSGKLPVPHGETNPETVGTTEVNPHNEAAAQRPASLPNDAYDGRVQGRRIEDLNALSDVDRLAHLRGWANDVRLGGPRSADWELFDKLVGEDPEKKRVREAQDEAQRKALSGERQGASERSELIKREGESEAEWEARKLASHEARKSEARPERDRP